MSKKYFVSSDIHSFFDQFISALTSAGFDVNNSDHILIICGDIFDRGNQTVELYNWLRSIPEDRLVLIQGNHELLYFDLLEKSFPDKHDYSNGTVKTFCALAGIDYREMDPHEIYFRLQLEGKNLSSSEVMLRLKATWHKVIAAVKKHEATKWLKSKNWVNFYEYCNMIFVHSFIPLELSSNNYDPAYKYYPIYEFSPNMLQPVSDWRTKTNILAWNDAKWGCPWRLFKAGLFKSEIDEGKRLVCGHWHASDFHYQFNSDTSNNMNIFFSESLIALDACTAASGFCNVLVIDEASRKCFDKNNNYLGDF